MKKRKSFIPLTERDFGLILGFGALATILELYPFPYVTAGAAVFAILLVRISEAPYVKETTSTETEHGETRSAEEIITSKLQSGAIEKAIDQRFDKMVTNVVDDLFGDYGDVAREIKKKLKETMNPYIEEYDYSQHNVKLEHLLNQLVQSVTKDQDDIARKFQTLMGTEAVKEMKTSELFNSYTKYLRETIETDDLEIDYDDRPSYKPLTAKMESEEDVAFSTSMEKQTLTFTCEENELMAIRVGLRRWTDLSDDAWHINKVERVNGKELSLSQKLHGNKEITGMETPITHLRDLNELEIHLLKLFYDKTDIVLDETEIYDDEVEIEEEPDMYLA